MGSESVSCFICKLSACVSTKAHTGTEYHWDHVFNPRDAVPMSQKEENQLQRSSRKKVGCKQQWTPGVPGLLENAVSLPGRSGCHKGQDHQASSGSAYSCLL